MSTPSSRDNEPRDPSGAAPGDATGLEWIATRRVTRVWHHVIVVLLIAFWIVPISTLGVFGGDSSRNPYLNRVRHLSWLFTERTDRWWSFHLEAKADGEWFALPYEEFAPMKTFGHISRLDLRIETIAQILLDPALREVRSLAEAQRDEMAEWARDRYVKLHPDRPPPTAVRLVGTYWDVSHPALLEPAGPWVQVDFDEVPQERKSVFGGKRFGPSGAAR